jgi:hypothetical protein
MSLGTHTGERNSEPSIKDSHILLLHATPSVAQRGPQGYTSYNVQQRLECRMAYCGPESFSGKRSYHFI